MSGGVLGGDLAVAEAVFTASRARFEQVSARMQSVDAELMTHSQLEESLGADMRQLARALYQDHLRLRELTEQRVPEVVDASGRERTRIERGRRRLLSTVFGKVTVSRIAYRGDGVGDLHPADAVLNLPAGMHSHGVAKQVAIEASRGSFAEAVDRVNALTGAGIAPRQAGELTVAAAADIDDFYAALVPEPCTDATVLVMSADEGVN